jgi:hypothetical protein
MGSFAGPSNPNAYFAARYRAVCDLRVRAPTTSIEIGDGIVRVIARNEGSKTPLEEGTRAGNVVA